jgi:hypothetical protein
MIRVLAVALCLLASTVHAGGGGKLDRENGFRGARFGSAPADAAGMELVSGRAAGGTATWIRPSDRLRLGNAKLDAVTYGYFDDQLYFVALFTSGRGNAKKALGFLEARYGLGTPVIGESREYVWRGRNVTLHFREDPATHMVMIGYTHVPLADQVRIRMRSVASQAPRSAGPDAASEASAPVGTGG